MQQMRRKDVDTPIIFLTQFETFAEGPDKLSLNELRVQLESLEGDKYIDTIYYDSAMDGWQNGLKDAIEQVMT